jgi:hypothetical protein
MVLPSLWVEAPPRQYRPNTLMDVANVMDVPSNYFMAGVEYEAMPCGFPAKLPVDACIVTVGPAAGNKNFRTKEDLVKGEVFGVYAGAECFLNGGSEELEKIARSLVEGGDYSVVESVVKDMLAKAATLPAQASIDVVDAIGGLEEGFYSMYTVLPVIYMSVREAYRAASRNILFRNLDGTLSTILGSKVAVMSTLPDGILYASGAINIWRGPIQMSEAADITHNKMRVIAERLHSVVIECGVQAINYKAPAAPTTPPAPPAPPAVGLLTIGTVPASPVEVGTDVTVHVHSEEALDGEVHLHLRVNGGGWTDLGEMTQTSSDEYVFNLQTDSHDAGDVLEVYADAESAMSETIDIHLEAS